MKTKRFLLIFLFAGIVSCYAMDMNNPNLYKQICAEFWDLDKPIAPQQEYEFFRKYIAQTQGDILEPMCGTGRYLIPYVEEGFKIDGFDASHYMMQALKEKCAQKNISPHVWEQFIEVVPETKLYDLIFIPDTSFAIFTDVEHAKKCLKKFYNLLKPNGTFVFDMQTPYSRWGNIGEWVHLEYENKEGNIVSESSLPFPIKNNISPLLLCYKIKTKDGLVLKSETEHYRIRLYSPDEMKKILKEVGFKKVKVIKAYEHQKKPEKTDGAVVYECIK